jgi:hypothetical protein
LDAKLPANWENPRYGGVTSLINDIEHVMLICSSRATNMDPTSSLTEDLSHLSVRDGNAPHEVAFPDASPQPTRVSRERDVFIDDDHKIYDAKIMNTFSSHRKHDEQPDLPALLSLTTLGDKRLVTLTPDEADELLTREPSIKILLQRVWKEGSFRQIRQLDSPEEQFALTLHHAAQAST